MIQILDITSSHTKKKAIKPFLPQRSPKIVWPLRKDGTFIKPIMVTAETIILDG